MRHKIPDDMKKEKMTLTIDGKVVELFDKYLEDNEITNKSKYIENLIRKDMENRGKEIINKF
jgi:metal-responsive CopG/Arc/MetJ family transcriptional regulator